jgi:hypothetical protein
LLTSGEIMQRDAEMNTMFRRMAALARLLAASLAAGLAFASTGGDEPPIQTIMEQVHQKNRAIGQSLRAGSALDAPGRKRLTAAAASMVQLGKQARALEEPARGRKKAQQEWTRTADEFVRAWEAFAGIVADPGSSKTRAIQSYQKLQGTCVRCHSTFREGAD